MPILKVEVITENFAENRKFFHPKCQNFTIRRVKPTTVRGADIPGAEPMRSSYLTLNFKTAEEAEEIYQILCNATRSIWYLMDDTTPDRQEWKLAKSGHLPLTGSNKL